MLHVSHEGADAPTQYTLAGLLRQITLQQGETLPHERQETKQMGPQTLLR